MRMNIDEITREDLEPKKPIDILVIGNGFDLANGLKTSYADFLDFCGEAGNNVNCECCSKIKELIKDNLWFNYFYKLYKSNIDIGERWIDFESEIAYILEECIDKQNKDFNQNVNIDEINVSYENINQNVNKRLSIFLGLIGIGTHNVNDLIDKLDDSLNVLIQALELWLIHVSKNTEIKLKQFSSEFNISHIVSFNYTNISSKIFPTIKNENKYFIHGKADITTAGDCNLILGIDMKIRNVGKLAIFNKDIQKINKNTNEELRNFFFDISMIFYTESVMTNYPNDMRIKVNLIFFGHSMDKTDKSILNRLLNLDKFIDNMDLNIIIYLYEAKLKNIAIVNVAEIIGQEALTEKDLCAGIEFRIISDKDKDKYAQNKFIVGN